MEKKQLALLCLLFYVRIKELMLIPFYHNHLPRPLLFEQRQCSPGRSDYLECKSRMSYLRDILSGNVGIYWARNVLTLNDIRRYLSTNKSSRAPRAYTGNPGVFDTGSVDDGVRKSRPGSPLGKSTRQVLSEKLVHAPASTIFKLIGISCNSRTSN